MILILLLSSADFFWKLFFQSIFQEHYQSVKWSVSRSGPTFCQYWSGNKQLISKGYQNTTKVAADKKREET